MVTVVSEKINDALNKAKISLMAKPDSAFFTTICFSLKQRFDDTVSTAMTNGLEILFNPKFFMSLDNEERIFLMLHESMHCAYLHTERIGKRHPYRWNIAADHVINLQLIKRGFKMPLCGIADRKYEGMSAEQIYDLLPDNPSRPVMFDLQASPSNAPVGQLQENIQDILVRAAIQSKIAQDKPGTIPGDIEIFLDNLLNPILPWHRILHRYMQNFTKNDYTFRKPNRRFFPKHHLPSLFSISLMDIAIAIDTSGSVSNSDFHRFITEIASLIKAMKPETTTLIQFDATIKSVTKIHNIDELIKVNFIGRGGTTINPVLEWANKNKPQLLLIFSDGEFNFSSLTTKVNTLWVIHNNKKFKAPFGKTIHYKV